MSPRAVCSDHSCSYCPPITAHPDIVRTLLWIVRMTHLHLGNLADAFCLKRLTLINQYIHTLMVVAAMQRPSGAVWDSVTCPRTLWHADQGNWTSNLPLTRCWLYPWPTADTTIIGCIWCIYTTMKVHIRRQLHITTLVLKKVQKSFCLQKLKKDRS